MPSQSDLLIENLAQSLEPTRPMLPERFLAGAGACLVLAAAFIVGILGSRPEVLTLRNTGQGLQIMIVLKPLVFLMIGGGALAAILDLSHPEGRLKIARLVPLAAVFAIFTMLFARDLTVHGVGATFDHAFGAAGLCFSTIFVGGLGGVGLMWQLWLRRSATSYPVLLGMMSGLAASTLSAAAYALHCNMDAPVYILLVYGSAVAAVVAISGFMGRRFLNW